MSDYNKEKSDKFNKKDSTVKRPGMGQPELDPAKKPSGDAWKQGGHKGNIQK